MTYRRSTNQRLLPLNAPLAGPNAACTQCANDPSHTTFFFATAGSYNPGDGGLDGVHYDVHGSLWALCGIGGIIEYDPRGIILGYMSLPNGDTVSTNFAFGGRNNQYIYMEGAVSGTIWRFKAPYPGLIGPGGVQLTEQHQSVASRAPRCRRRPVNRRNGDRCKRGRSAIGSKKRGARVCSESKRTAAGIRAMRSLAMCASSPVPWTLKSVPSEAPHQSVQPMVKGRGDPFIGIHRTVRCPDVQVRNPLQTKTRIFRRRRLAQSDKQP